MTNLSKLQLVDKQPVMGGGVSPIENARAKLIERINEQIALVKNPALTRETTKDVDGEQQTVNVPVRPWFFEDTSGDYFIQVRYGVEKLKIQGKTAIQAGKKGDLEKTFNLLAEAVKAGELDDVLAAARKKRSRSKSKS